MSANNIFSLVIFLVVTTLFWFPMTIVSASSLIALSGTAKVENTEGSIYFDQYHSNVVVDSKTGRFSGFVFSEDVGWIDFGNDGKDDAVRVDLSTGEISGKAYIINTGSSIDFSGNNANASIRMSDGTFSGHGWSEDVGWVNMSGTVLTQPISILTLVNTGGRIFIVYIFIVSLLATIVLNRKLRKHFMQMKFKM